jgi:hypothetical protein
MDPAVPEDVQARARRLVEELDPQGDHRVASELLAAALGLLRDDPDPLDLKMRCARRSACSPRIATSRR